MSTLVPSKKKLFSNYNKNVIDPYIYFIAKIIICLKDYSIKELRQRLLDKCLVLNYKT